jgi:hypothetical protein
MPKIPSPVGKNLEVKKSAWVLSEAQTIQAKGKTVRPAKKIIRP